MFIVLVLLLALVAGLASVTLLLGAIYALWAWYMGELIAVAWIVAAGAALLWSLLGRHIVLLFHRKGTDDPQRHGSGEVSQRPDCVTIALCIQAAHRVRASW